MATCHVCPEGCRNCGHSAAMHWPDDARMKPGCHAVGCLCPLDPDQLGDNTFPDGDMYDHVRRYHPDWDVQRWPDGAPVVVDTTLEPADFGGER